MKILVTCCSESIVEWEAVTSVTEKKNPHVFFCMLSKDMSDGPDVKKTHTEFSFDSKAEEQVKVRPSLSVFTSAPHLFHDKHSNPPNSASLPLADLSQQKAQPEEAIHLSRV